MKANLLREIGKLSQIIFRPEMAPLLPSYADIEITNYCNLDCLMCRRHTWGKERKLRHMPVNEFIAIIKQLPFLRCVNLSALGEPLIHPDFSRIIDICTDYKIKPWFVSNATLISHLDNLELNKIVKAISQIIFSIDSPDANTYERLRKGAKFEEVIKCVQRFVEIRNKANPKLPVILHMLLMEENYFQIKDMILLTHKLGLNYLNVGILSLFDSVRKSKEIRQASFEHSCQAKVEAMNLAGELNVNIRFWDSMTKWRKMIGCHWPWTHPVITVEGFVTPCCFLADSREINFGNIFQTPFRTIWNSNGYINFRRDIRARSYPDPCLNVQCTYVYKSKV